MGWVSVHAPCFLVQNVLHRVSFIFIVESGDYFARCHTPYELALLWCL